MVPSTSSWGISPANPSQKSKPHYALEELWSLLAAGERSMTKSALKDAVSLGISETEVYEIVGSLERRHFKVSNADYQKKGDWQDAYRCSCRAGMLYIKLKVAESEGCRHVRILSFKRAEDRGGMA